MAESVNIATAGATTLREQLGKPFGAAAADAGKLTRSLGETSAAVRDIGDAGRSTGSALSSMLSVAGGMAIGSAFTAGAGALSSLAGSMTGAVGEGVKLAA